MQEAVEAIVAFGKFYCELLDLIFMFDIARKHGGITNQLLHLFATRFISYGVDDFRSGINQHAAYMPGDALAIGDAHHKDALAGELEKVGHKKLTTETRRARRRELLKLSG